MRTIAGAPTISRPIEIERVQIAPGVWLIRMSDGELVYGVDGRAMVVQRSEKTGKGKRG